MPRILLGELTALPHILYIAGLSGTLLLRKGKGEFHLLFLHLFLDVEH